MPLSTAPQCKASDLGRVGAWENPGKGQLLVLPMIPEARFYREVRQFALRSPSHSPYRQVVRSYPSERHNLSMLALRVYGDTNETMTILAAAGLSNVDSELVEQDIVLPTSEYLAYLKQLSGIVTTTRPVR